MQPSDQRTTYHPTTASNSDPRIQPPSRSVSTSSKRTSRIHHSPLTSVLAPGKAQVPQPTTQFVTSPPSRLKLRKEGERKSDHSSRSSLNRIISAHPPSSPAPNSISSNRTSPNASSFDPGTREPTSSIEPNPSPSKAQQTTRASTQDLDLNLKESSQGPSESQRRRSSMAKRTTWLPSWSSSNMQPTSPNEHDNSRSGSQIPSTSSSSKKISNVIDSPPGQKIQSDSTPVDNPNDVHHSSQDSITNSPPAPVRPSTWFGFSNKVSDEPVPSQPEDKLDISPVSTAKHSQDGSHDASIEPTYPPAPTTQPQQPYLSRWYPSILTSASATHDAPISTERSTRVPSGDLIDTKSPSTAPPHTVPPDRPPSTPTKDPPPPQETEASKAEVALSTKSSRTSWWGWNNPSSSGFPLPTTSETHSVSDSEEPSVIDASSLEVPEVQTTPTINNPNNQTYTSRVGSWVYSWYDNQSALSGNQNGSDQPQPSSHDDTLEEAPTETTPNLRTSNISDLIPNPVSESIPDNSRGWAGMFSTRRVIPARDIDEERKSVETMEIGSSGSGSEDPSAIDSTRVSQPPVASTLLSRIPSLRRKEPAGPNLSTGSVKHIKMATDADLMRQDPTIQPSSSFTSRYWRTSTPQTQAQQSLHHPNPDTESEPPKSEIHRPLTDSTLPSPKISMINGKARATIPNLILPTFEDTFMHPPRSFLPKSMMNNKLKKTIDLVQAYVFAVPPTLSDPTKLETDQQTKDRMIQEVFQKNKHISTRLPKSLETLGISSQERLKRIQKVSVIGIHGWFPGPWLESLIGKPTGTSEKFSTMMGNALRDYLEKEMNGSLNQEFITLMPLEGDGKVDKRVDNLYNELYKRQDWVNALHESDAIFVVAHSQGSIVSCKLLERLIRMDGISAEKVMLLCMCGIWSGPFMGLNNSYTFQPVLKLLEGPAAHELFEFQDPRSKASRSVLASMNFCLSSGIKILLVGSLNDQVVPLYSALYNSISHPSILRSIFIDPEVYRSTDFLTNLITFCQRLKNSGLSDHGLQNHLSDVLVGSLSGVGHSSVYEDKDVYDLAIRYFFETSSPLESPTYLSQEFIESQSKANQSRRLPSSLLEIDLSFSPKEKPNPYLLTWSLRGLIDDKLIEKLFEKDLKRLRVEFGEWRPVSKGLKELKMRLEPLKIDSMVVERGMEMSTEEEV